MAETEGGVFDAYAAYYDLLYRDKDYAGEAAYVHGLIRRYAPGARDILELGCGTGRHAEALMDLGFRVTGVDRSGEMVARARERAAGRHNFNSSKAICAIFVQAGSTKSCSRCSM